jgi:hypothetical protein
VMITPVLQVGASVDDYLRREGALAQAVDRCTVLLSSEVAHMRPRDRRLILLHELAHLHQLARPGNDPECALEAEAWDAAYSWSEGRPVRIRGRARGRLNAVALIQGGAKGHPHAPVWYTASPVEPIGAQSTIKVESSVLLEHIDFEAVLDQMIAAKASEVVIVSHGDGNGLALPLKKGASAGAERVVIDALAADKSEDVVIGGQKIRTPVKSDKDVADLTKLSETDVKALRAKMSQVRRMKLAHVAFRACNMGIKVETLEAFRAFFGAASVSAPTQFDSYGRFSPSIEGDVGSWAKARRKSGFHISIDGQVAFGTKTLDNALVYQVVAHAASKDAFREWVRTHVADGAWGPNGVVYHGVKVLHPLGPQAPSVYFVRDEAFIANIVHHAG